jgi:hypothetical protein
LFDATRGRVGRETLETRTGSKSEEDGMVRRIIAGAAVAGVLSLGAAGAAGAATGAAPTSSSSTTTTTPVTASCADLAKLLQRYHAKELKAGARDHKVAATESRLRKLGHSKLAGIYAKRVHAAQSREKRIVARLHKAVRQCAGAAPSGAKKGSGSSKGSGKSAGSGSSKSSGSSAGSGSSPGA